MADVGLLSYWRMGWQVSGAKRRSKRSRRRRKDNARQGQQDNSAGDATTQITRSRSLDEADTSGFTSSMWTKTVPRAPEGGKGQLATRHRTEDRPEEKENQKGKEKQKDKEREPIRDQPITRPPRHGSPLPRAEVSTLSAPVPRPSLRPSPRGASPGEKWCAWREGRKENGLVFTMVCVEVLL